MMSFIPRLKPGVTERYKAKMTGANIKPILSKAICQKAKQRLYFYFGLFIKKNDSAYENVFICPIVYAYCPLYAKY